METPFTIRLTAAAQLVLQWGYSPNESTPDKSSGYSIRSALCGAASCPGWAGGEVYHNRDCWALRFRLGGYLYMTGAWHVEYPGYGMGFVVDEWESAVRHQMTGYTAARMLAAAAALLDQASEPEALAHTQLPRV